MIENEALKTSSESIQWATSKCKKTILTKIRWKFKSQNQRRRSRTTFHSLMQSQKKLRLIFQKLIRSNQKLWAKSARILQVLSSLLRVSSDQAEIILLIQWFLKSHKLEMILTVIKFFQHCFLPKDLALVHRFLIQRAFQVREIIATDHFKASPRSKNQSMTTLISTKPMANSSIPPWVNGTEFQSISTWPSSQKSTLIRKMNRRFSTWETTVLLPIIKWVSISNKDEKII